MALYLLLAASFKVRCYQRIAGGITWCVSDWLGSTWGRILYAPLHRPPSRKPTFL